MTSALPGLDVRFAVKGTPAPKGSMSGFPISRGRCDACAPPKRCGRRNCFGGTIVGVSVTDQGDEALKVWQGQIHYAALSARNAARQRVLDPPGAACLSAVFVVARPDHHWTTRGELSAAGRERPWPTTKPDVDKCLRTVQDALTEVLVHDDAQIVVARAAEVYADRRGWTGVACHVRQLLSHDAWIEHEISYHAGIWQPPASQRQEELL